MSKVEWQGVVELDIQELVEVMKEVQVGSVDWAMCPAVRMNSGLWIYSKYKVETEVTEVVTFAVSVRQPLA